MRDDAVFFLEDRLVEAHARLATPTAGDVLVGRADALITPEEATGAFLKKIERMAPFGIQNPKPLFLMQSVVVQSLSHFGKSEEHLKLTIGSSDQRHASIDAVAFFAKGALARRAAALTIGSRVHILVHLERDTFSRGSPIRLRLIALAPEPATI